jgi:hypothetical protein
MSNERALEFLDRWEADHVEAVPSSQWGSEAARLADICREDAIRAGVSLVDLQRAARGNLVQNMLDALSWAADEKRGTI